VARLIPRNRGVKIKSAWDEFKSLKLSIKILFITIILFAISLPFIVNNYQSYRARGESQAQALQEIQRLQAYQGNLKNSLASDPTTEKDINVAKPAEKFNFIDAIRKILLNILNFFKK
jgi:hypothetical protein